MNICWGGLISPIDEVEACGFFDPTRHFLRELASRRSISGTGIIKAWGIRDWSLMIKRELPPTWKKLVEGVMLKPSSLILFPKTSCHRSLSWIIVLSRSLSSWKRSNHLGNAILFIAFRSTLMWSVSGSLLREIATTGTIYRGTWRWLSNCSKNVSLSVMESCAVKNTWVTRKSGSPSRRPITASRKAHRQLR